MTLLAAGDPEPVNVENRGSESPFLLVCDHAGRRTPSNLGTMGLPAAEWDRHVAYDIGAEGLTAELAAALGGACTVRQVYSRLVIDCNRDPAWDDAFVHVADGAEVVANRDLTPSMKQARVEAVHAPYHAAISEVLDERAARGLTTALVLVHSFTPVMGGVARPWHLGVLHQANPMSLQALAWLQSQPDLVVGDNEPYAMDEVDYTAPRHAGARGLQYLELETRQDLIADTSGQRRFAALYARMLKALERRI